MDADSSSTSQSNRLPHSSDMLLYLLPLFELILGAFFLGMLVSKIQKHDLETQWHNTYVNCMTYSDRIMADLKSGIAITDSLEQIVIIRVPDIFSSSLTSLDYFGYQYRLLKTSSPWDPTFVEFCRSEKALVNPVSHWFSLGGDLWELQLMPNSAWAPSRLSQVVLWTGFVILVLLAVLTCAVILLEERRKYLRYLSETDKLTGIYNRSGFDDQLDHHIRRHPDQPCIVAELDIDNFKSINDLYGHPTGDRALQTLVSSLRRFFASDVIIGRNGGDEFCLLLPGETRTSVAEKLRVFSTAPKTFASEDQMHAFTISLGYAEYLGTGLCRLR